jgi:hypothetical protein
MKILLAQAENMRYSAFVSSDAFEVQRRPIYKAERPVRDPKYLAMLRKLCCVVCGSFRSVEAAHMGPHGMAQKSSDLDALPLCVKCHRIGPKSYHVLGARRFIEVHALNVELHQKQCRTFYEKRSA